LGKKRLSRLGRTSRRLPTVLTGVDSLFGASIVVTAVYLGLFVIVRNGFSAVRVNSGKRRKKVGHLLYQVSLTVSSQFWPIKPEKTE
jgi:hypothetical protein